MKSLEVKNQHWRQFPDLHVFECLLVLFAMRTVPLLALAELFFDSEQIQALIDVDSFV